MRGGDTYRAARRNRLHGRQHEGNTPPAERNRSAFVYFGRTPLIRHNTSAPKAPPREMTPQVTTLFDRAALHIAMALSGLTRR